MIGYIYNIILKGEVIYVGSTINLTQRIKDHKKKCYGKSSDCYNKQLYQFIRDNCKWDELSFEIIKEVEVIDVKELRKMEGEYI